MRTLTSEEMSGLQIERLDRLFNNMAEIQHNKRKITDTFFRRYGFHIWLCLYFKDKHLTFCSTIEFNP